MSGKASVAFQILNMDNTYEENVLSETQTSNHETEHGKDNKYIPPQGHWRDGIFDCLNNIWPSFCCTVCGGTWLRMFYAAQISQRIGFMKLTHIATIFIISCLIFYFVGFIIFVALVANITDPTEQEVRYSEAENNMIFLFVVVPAFMIWGFVFYLRFIFVARYRIDEDSSSTFIYSCFCNPCSLCQMGRHIFGYSRLFDGDGKLDGSMNYQLIEEQRNERAVNNVQNPIISCNE